MPKSVRIGIWLTFVASALMVQGCWDEQQEQKLTLLGEGGCRTADGGEGEHTTVQTTSSDACEAQCFVDGKTCVAVEYNADNNNCEVHHQPITSVAEVKGVACYVVN